MIEGHAVTLKKGCKCLYISIYSLVTSGAYGARTRDLLHAKQALSQLSYVHEMERKTGFEPATPTLGKWYSTAELLPHIIPYNYPHQLL